MLWFLNRYISSMLFDNVLLTVVISNLCVFLVSFSLCWSSLFYCWSQPISASSLCNVLQTCANSIYLSRMSLFQCLISISNSLSLPYSDLSSLFYFLIWSSKFWLWTFKQDISLSLLDNIFSISLLVSSSYQFWFFKRQFPSSLIDFNKSFVLTSTYRHLLITLYCSNSSNCACNCDLITGYEFSIICDYVFCFFDESSFDFDFFVESSFDWLLQR